MGTNRLVIDPKIETPSFEVPDDKTPILGYQQKDVKSKLRSKWFIILIGLIAFVVLTVTIVSIAVVYPEHASDARIPDPEFPLPPSTMPMGLYRHAGVVSNGEQCADVGVNVMKNGGNAVDAAIATMICDGAARPHQMGVGGGFLMSIFNATTKKVMSVNAREMAPAAANASMFINEPEKATTGGLAIAIPGALKGYSDIYHKFGGGVPWASLFEPTIQLCEDGMEINDHLEITLLGDGKKKIESDPMLRKIFFDEKINRGRKSGEVYKFPKLANTFKVIAKEGVKAIYNGSLTSELLADLKNVDSIITREDLLNYRTDIQETFAVKLKNGHTIHAGPPPGSGIILAFILRILDGIVPAPNAGLDAHRLVEAFKFGYGERSHLGDKEFVNVSKIYEKVNSDSYVKSIQNKIHDNFTSLDPKYYGADFYLPEDHGTANMVVIDAMGNVVVCTSTVNTHFGSGFMSPSTGIIFNNEMDDFSTPGVINHYGIPSSPSNYIEPGKRPQSSICPTVFTDKNGDFAFAAGAAGGSKITLATSYLSALKLWYNYTLKEILDRPRMYHQLMPMEILYEYGWTRDVIQKLQEIGHPLVRLKNNHGAGGSAASAIARSPSGMVEAMPDYRRPGNSSGY